MTRHVRTYTMQGSTALTTDTERTMETTLEERLRTRIVLRATRWHADGADDFPGFTALVDGIMRDVETYGVLRAREGYGLAEMRAGRSRHIAQQDAASHLPLPKRTRRVLREEPDPHGYAVLYCYNPEVRMILGRAGYAGSEWRKDINQLLGDGHFMQNTMERIHLWTDLIANPYRTEEVPADESNPWGDE